jgi:hypothetical protein
MEYATSSRAASSSNRSSSNPNTIYKPNKLAAASIKDIAVYNDTSVLGYNSAGVSCLYDVRFNGYRSASKSVVVTYDTPYDAPYYTPTHDTTSATATSNTSDTLSNKLKLNRYNRGISLYKSCVFAAVTLSGSNGGSSSSGSRSSSSSSSSSNKCGIGVWKDTGQWIGLASNTATNARDKTGMHLGGVCDDIAVVCDGKSVYCCDLC